MLWGMTTRSIDPLLIWQEWSVCVWGGGGGRASYTFALHCVLHVKRGQGRCPYSMEMTCVINGKLKGKEYNIAIKH